MQVRAFVIGQPLKIRKISQFFITIFHLKIINFTAVKNCSIFHRRIIIMWIIKDLLLMHVMFIVPFSVSCIQYCMISE